MLLSFPIQHTAVVLQSNSQRSMRLYGTLYLLFLLLSFTLLLFTFPPVVSLLSFVWTRHSCSRTFTLAGYSAQEALVLDLCLANCLTFFIPLLRFYLQPGLPYLLSLIFSPAPALFVTSKSPSDSFIDFMVK